MTKKNGPKILLVDDDRDMCDSLTDVLSLDSGYNIFSSTDPLKALEMAKTNDYALIIVDYKMPKMNGIEFLRGIKKAKPKCPVFILTAFISSELIDQATKEGADRVLSKFIWPDEILQFIKEIITE